MSGVPWLLFLQPMTNQGRLYYRNCRRSASDCRRSDGSYGNRGKKTQGKTARIQKDSRQSRYYRRQECRRLFCRYGRNARRRIKFKKISTPPRISAEALLIITYAEKKFYFRIKNSQKQFTNAINTNIMYSETYLEY